MKCDEQNMGYVHIPKELFQEASYRKLSTTAKLLYSLCLERAQFSDMNKWKDERGRYYILYPKSQMMRDLGCGRSRTDSALAELKQQGEMLFVTCPCNGKANRIYVHDITKEISKKMNEEDMDDMRKGEMENPAEEKEYRVIADTEEKQDQLDMMVKYGYADEYGALDIDEIEEAADDFGLGLALALVENFNRRGRVRILEQLNFYANLNDWKRTQVILETLATASGMDDEEIMPLLVCFGKGRKIFVKEAVTSTNSFCNEIRRMKS